MKKLFNELNDKIKLMSGTLICFGTNEEKLLDDISKNKNILVCDILTNATSSSESGKGKSKKVDIKKIRKRYKKNKVNYIICNLNEMEKYKKTFIRDSIYINKGKTYIYYNKKEDLEYIINKYKRYNTVISKIECLDGVVFEVDTIKAKTNKIKDIFYNIIDSILDILNVIGDLLAS